MQATNFPLTLKLPEFKLRGGDPLELMTKPAAPKPMFHLAVPEVVTT
jgi:hypothetical protein